MAVPQAKASELTDSRDGFPLVITEETFKRAQLVKKKLASNGITDPRVLAAMNTVPRHLFVPEKLKARAYENNPLPIELKQTISQPFVVAYMSQEAQICPQDRILEIGTGSGYQAAILSLLAREVYSIEILKPLGLSSKKRLKDLGYDNVSVKIGDGNLGWPEHAPYDVILVTAGAPEIPPALLRQLKPGGRLIMPVGAQNKQVLKRVTKTANGFRYETLIGVRFVPLTS
jgi:protein-L-isoaspartate(D-aspartate) O-methyltransferase